MTTLYNALNINGVISTDKTVLQNLNELCTASGTFLTYDISQGKWAVIINRTGTSVKSYNNSNIIGNVNVSETGVSELYNSTSFEFPHRLLRDQTDFVEVSIPSGDRYPNEVANTLNIQNTLVNDPVQAQYLAGVELKQSRLNKVITFTTDYTSLGLKAGDLIDVTLDMYDYTNKIFRVTKVEENDGDVIAVTITALEYSEDVYSTDGLVAVEKTKKTGILLKQQNEALQAQEDAGVAGSIGRMIAANVGLGIANSLLNKLFGRRQIGVDANGNPIYDNKTNPNDENVDKVLGGAKKPALTSITSNSSVCAGQSITITVGCNCSSCLFTIPDFDYDYEITGVLEEDLDVLLEGKVTVSNGTGLLTIFVAEGAPQGTMSVTIGGLNKSITINEVKDYSYTVTKNNASITEGGTVIVTLAATGDKLNSTIPYAITGSAAGKVSSPALTGNVTTINGAASLTIVTTDDSVYQGTQGLTVTFEPSLSDPCNQVGANSTSITVLDNDTAPPTPPSDTSCQYITVPVTWCGTYDGTDEQLKSVSVRTSASFAVAQAGEPTVQLPLTLTVTKGNPSTISVATYATVAQPIAPMGGREYKVITSFNTVVPKGLITGTVTTVTGN